LKGSKEFQDENERMFIIQNLKMVDRVFLSVDTDRTVSKTIELIHSLGDRDDEFLFANGGDQNNNSIPETPVCDWLGVKLIDGLGDKIQSSSWLLNK
jgi:hypothetical protein